MTHKLVLFSGLAADARVFVGQKVAFPSLVVPSWPIPQWSESLQDYCRRLADQLQDMSDESAGELVIGGASFGGIVALEVARYTDPEAVVLIGSLRSPSELPRYARVARPLAPLVKFIPVRLLQVAIFPAASEAARRIFPFWCGLARQFRDADPTVFKWSLIQILKWDSPPEIGCPVYRLHGSRDFVLPVKYTDADEVVQGAGHVPSLSHAKQVNEFLRRVLNTVENSGLE